MRLIIFSILILFFHFNVKGQDNSDKINSYSIDCKKATDSMYYHTMIDSIRYDYLVFSIYRGIGKLGSSGSVVLKNFQNFSKEHRKQLAIQLITQFELISIGFFESCDVVQVYYQAMKHTPEQKKSIILGTDFFYSKDLP